MKVGCAFTTTTGEHSNYGFHIFMLTMRNPKNDGLLHKNVLMEH